jgi:hypothetical protein
MAETDRTVVKTYVPEYQKDTWRSDAEEMGMSQSEFVRAMVQAGRRDIELEPAEGGSGGVDPGGQALETCVRQTLEDGPRTWDQLRDEFVDRLQATLEAMQSAGELRYDPADGYAIDDE